MWKPNTRAILALTVASLLMTSCGERRRIGTASPPPPETVTLKAKDGSTLLDKDGKPIRAVDECRTVVLPIPYTEKQWRQWNIDDAEADAECNAKRRALAEAWPR